MAEEPVAGEVRWLGDLARLRLEPGDRFVLTVPDRLTMEQIECLREQWARFCGGSVEQYPCLILEEGIRVGVINTGGEGG